MRALAKLINVNEPDMTLFVGEALVGNEAVDQLVKFNRALANQASVSSTRTQMIDGIVLTKFDTIDDKVSKKITLVFYLFYAAKIYSPLNLSLLLLLFDYLHI